MAYLDSIAFALRSGVQGATAEGVVGTARLMAAGAATVLNFVITNSDASNDAYLQVFDAATAGAVTVGTTTALQSIFVPRSSTIILIKSLAVASGVVVAGTTTATGSTPAVTALKVGYSI